RRGRGVGAPSVTMRPMVERVWAPVPPPPPPLPHCPLEYLGWVGEGCVEKKTATLSYVGMTTVASIALSFMGPLPYGATDAPFLAGVVARPRPEASSRARAAHRLPGRVLPACAAGDRPRSRTPEHWLPSPSESKRTRASG